MPKTKETQYPPFSNLFMQLVGLYKITFTIPLEIVKECYRNTKETQEPLIVEYLGKSVDLAVRTRHHSTRLSQNNHTFYMQYDFNTLWLNGLNPYDYIKLETIEETYLKKSTYEALDKLDEELGIKESDLIQEYLAKGKLLYNIEGEINLLNARPDLPRQKRKEVLKEMLLNQEKWKIQVNPASNLVSNINQNLKTKKVSSFDETSENKKSLNDPNSIVSPRQNSSGKSGPKDEFPGLPPGEIPKSRTDPFEREIPKDQKASSEHLYLLNKPFLSIKEAEANSKYGRYRIIKWCSEERDGCFFMNPDKKNSFKQQHSKEITLEDLGLDKKDIESYVVEGEPFDSLRQVKSEKGYHKIRVFRNIRDTKIWNWYIKLKNGKIYGL